MGDFVFGDKKTNNTSIAFIKIRTFLNGRREQNCMVSSLHTIRFQHVQQITIKFQLSTNAFVLAAGCNLPRHVAACVGMTRYDLVPYYGPARKKVNDRNNPTLRIYTCNWYFWCSFLVDCIFIYMLWTFNRWRDLSTLAECYNTFYKWVFVVCELIDWHSYFVTKNMSTRVNYRGKCAAFFSPLK